MSKSCHSNHIRFNQECEPWRYASSWVLWFRFQSPPPSAALFKSVEASIFESLGDVMSSAILAVTQPLVSECQSVMSGSKKSWSLNETSLTPPKFNIAPEKLPKPSRKVVFQPPFFRGYVKLRVRIYSTSHRRKPKMVRLVKEIHSTPLNTAIKTFWPYSNQQFLESVDSKILYFPEILLMEELLHHLGCIKPCK